MPTLACWWLSIHFDIYIYIYIFSVVWIFTLYIWIVGIFYGSLSIWLVELLVLELFVNVILIKCKCIVLGTLRN